MLDIIGFLLLAPALGFRHRAFHRTRDAIGVENDLAVGITRGAADRLDQAGFRTQETLLVGIENRDQAAFGDVEALAQQVDADQHVIDAQPQITDQLDPLQGLDVGVHVADLHARFVQIFGQILRHPLGQGRHQRAIALGCGELRLMDQIVDLALDRAHFDRRIDQPGRADHLFGEDAARALHLPRSRRRRDIDGLRAHRVPFVEAQRAIVDARRQAEAIFGQRDLPPMITARHAADLRHRLMTLVDEQQGVFGEIFEQGRRRLAGQAAGEEAAVILDAGAAAGGSDHLEIEMGALLQSLRLEQLALDLKLLQPL